mmetsp:Transcript_51181/g.110983  ORF Transcript_51181/g.110983 Transcript_51181/m.110983 type:complete len:84 (-) Transcript_51181:221-472(-)
MLPSKLLTTSCANIAPQLHRKMARAWEGGSKQASYKAGRLEKQKQQKEKEKKRRGRGWASECPRSVRRDTKLLIVKEVGGWGA